MQFANKKSSLRACPTGTEIQSLVLHKPHFTLSRAILWAKSHGFTARKVDETIHAFRFRQKEPGTFITGLFRTMTLTDGVQAVIGCPR